ncbi:MAG: hypothetical protein RR448_10910 [Niameybacter sp.]
MKKVWKAPQVMGLGVESTKEEAGTLEGEKIFYKCQYCSETFLFKKARDMHEKTCFSRPAVPGGELPDIGVVPMS